MADSTCTGSSSVSDLGYVGLLTSESGADCADTLLVAKMPPAFSRIFLAWGASRDATLVATRFVNIDRDTPLLLPPDLRDWVPGDHLAHFIITDGGFHRAKRPSSRSNASPTELRRAENGPGVPANRLRQVIGRSPWLRNARPLAARRDSKQSIEETALPNPGVIIESPTGC
jgi:hypothetical protein